MRLSAVLRNYWILWATGVLLVAAAAFLVALAPWEPVEEPSAEAFLPSSDPAPLVVIPELTGRSEAEAMALLEEAGLSPDMVRRAVEYSPQPDGEVLHQEPASGTIAFRTAEVTITVSSQFRLLPDVVGLSREEALTRIRDAGLGETDLFIQTVEKLGAQGLVVSQDPKPGANNPVLIGLTVEVPLLMADPEELAGLDELVAWFSEHGVAHRLEFTHDPDAEALYVAEVSVPTGTAIGAEEEVLVKVAGPYARVPLTTMEELSELIWEDVVGTEMTDGGVMPVWGTVKRAPRGCVIRSETSGRHGSNPPTGPGAACEWNRADPEVLSFPILSWGYGDEEIDFWMAGEFSGLERIEVDLDGVSWIQLGYYEDVMGSDTGARLTAGIGWAVPDHFVKLDAWLDANDDSVRLVDPVLLVNPLLLES